LIERGLETLVEDLRSKNQFIRISIGIVGAGKLGTHGRSSIGPNFDATAHAAALADQKTLPQIKVSVSPTSA
jgi:hypothetical protein